MLSDRHARLERELVAAARGERGLGVIVADVDHFEQVNDAYGHPAGDDVLRAVPERICGAMRNGDGLGRIGGDEFVILLPGGAAETVPLTAERVRARRRDPRRPDRSSQASTG